MFLSKLPGWWFDVDKKPIYHETGVTNFGDKMRLFIAMFRDEFHENEGLWVFQKDKYSLDDFSWTYQRHWDELAALTQNQSEGMMNHRYEWNVKKITQPKWSRWWSEVSCSRATCYRKICVHFPKFSPVICRPVPLYFLTSLRRITYAWFIIQPFGWIMYHYLII